VRILNAINSTNPAGGGPIESIVQAHLALKDQGHEIEAVCLDAPDSPWLSQLPFRVHAAGPAATKYRYSPRYIPWLKQHAAEYDCVIVHGVWLFPSAGVWLALRGSGTPYFVYSHGMLDPSFRRLFPLKHVAKSALWKLIEHRAMEQARAVFFTCEEERRLARESFTPYRVKEAIVPYCVGMPPGDPDAQRRAFLGRWPELPSKRIILFLSRIHPKKGCDALIDAFSQMAARDPALHLVMAGPDPIRWQESLQRRARDLGIADRVTWTGMLTGDLKWGAFRAAEAFALPSHQENFGIAVVEALACAVPVLISNRINIWREIGDDGAGLVSDPGAAAFAGNLAKWLSLDLAQRQAMKHNAARCFASRFRSDQAAANLLQTLHSHGVADRRP